MTAFPRALGAALLCAFALACARAAAQDAAGSGSTPFPGRAFLDRIEAGQVWCLEPRPSEMSCRFILRAPSLRLMADDSLTEGIGYWLIADAEFGFVKQEQLFRYFVADDRVCLGGPSVRRDDMRFYAPATRRADVGLGDHRLRPDLESQLQALAQEAWAAFETTCWSYRLEERFAELDGPEVAMTRYHDGVEQEGLRVGAFYAQEAAEALRLYVLD